MGTNDTQHSNGQTWKLVADRTTIEGFAITALSANDIWAVGIYGRLTTNIPAINHWDGHS